MHLTEGIQKFLYGEHKADTLEAQWGIVRKLFPVAAEYDYGYQKGGYGLRHNRLWMKDGTYFHMERDIQPYRESTLTSGFLFLGNCQTHDIGMVVNCGNGGSPDTVFVQPGDGYHVKARRLTVRQQNHLKRVAASFESGLWNKNVLTVEAIADYPAGCPSVYLILEDEMKRDPAVIQGVCAGIHQNCRSLYYHMQASPEDRPHSISEYFMDNLYPMARKVGLANVLDWRGIRNQGFQYLASQGILEPVQRVVREFEGCARFVDNADRVAEALKAVCKEIPEGSAEPSAFPADKVLSIIKHPELLEDVRQLVEQNGYNLAYALDDCKGWTEEMTDVAEDYRFCSRLLGYHLTKDPPQARTIGKPRLGVGL